MKNSKILVLLFILNALISCSSNEKKFIDWEYKNQGKKFTDESMKELVSIFGNPTDTTHGGDLLLENYNMAYYLGPAFEAEEGKRLYNEVTNERKNFNNYWKNYMNKTGEEQGLTEARFSSENAHWEEYKNALDEFYEKQENTYKEKSKNKQFTLNEFINSYKEKFPKLTFEQCIDSIKDFQFPGISEYDLNRINSTTYKFLTEKSISYKKYMRKEKEDIKDFKIEVSKEIEVLKDGTIKMTPGSSYRITDESRNELKKMIVGVDWVYKTGNNLIAAIKYSDDGTYRYSTKMFGGISKQGTWRINNDGEIDASNQDGVIKITNSGIRIGSTVYVKD